MYKVIYDEFYDMKDETKHVYHKGDIFPFDNRKISPKRIEELSTANNKIGVPLIRKIEETE